MSLEVRLSRLEDRTLGQLRVGAPFDRGSSTIETVMPLPIRNNGLIGWATMNIMLLRAYNNDSPEKTDKEAGQLRRLESVMPLPFSNDSRVGWATMHC